jgi:hypothetical protein
MKQSLSIVAAIIGCGTLVAADTPQPDRVYCHGLAVEHGGAR